MVLSFGSIRGYGDARRSAAPFPLLHISFEGRSPGAPTVGRTRPGDVAGCRPVTDGVASTLAAADRAAQISIAILLLSSSRPSQQTDGSGTGAAEARAFGRFFRGPTEEGDMATRVLIAEDESIIRLDLRALLERAGFEVCAEAGDGRT